MTLRTKTAEESRTTPPTREIAYAAGRATLPDYVTDSSISITRVSKQLLRDLRRLDVDDATALYAAVAVRIHTEFHRLMDGEGNEDRGLRLGLRLIEARNLVVAKMQQREIEKLRAQHSLPPVS